MALNDLREAIALLSGRPVLLVPGIVGGIAVSLLWLSLNFSGAFFTSRLLVIFALILIFLITGMYSLIKSGERDLRSMLKGGGSYYFRVLLPQLVIVFAVLVVFILCVITFSLIGMGSDFGLLTIFTFAIMIPTLILTSFFDAAAVFEDRHVFDSIRRSSVLVSAHMRAVLVFYAVCAIISSIILFGLMIVWEALLFDKLKPIMDFTDAQRESFTPDQLMGMIGPEGIWITAGILFVALLLLIPVIFSYKAVFFRKMTSTITITQQPTIGEYDSKGRWYKY